MAIGDDWTIDYNDKTVKHTSGTDIYTVRNLYTWLQDTFDELNQMDDDVPMSAQTPTEFTMINGWFIDDDSTQYLKGGAIATSGYSGEIQVLQLQTGWTNAVAGDIGKQVEDDASPVGALLAYNNTTGKWWVRSTSTIASGSTMTIADSGTGAGTADANSLTGEDLYPNIYTLGTIALDPPAQIYVFQDGSAISEWSTLDNWDPYGSFAGHLDILVKVKEADVEIDGAVVTVYARQFGDNYDFFEIDLTNGGRNAVPLATSTDLNNPTQEFYLMYDAEVTAPSVGDTIEGNTSGDRAEVVAINDLGTTGIISIGGATGIFTDNEDLLIASPLATVGSVLGQAGEQYVTASPVASPFTLGEDLQIDGTINASLHGYAIVAATAHMVLGSADGLVSDNDKIVGTVSLGSADAAGIGNPGIKQYALSPTVTIRFINATMNTDKDLVAFAEGDVILGSTSRSTAVVMESNSGSELVIGNMASGPFVDNETIYRTSGTATRAASVNSPGPMTASHTMGRAFTQQSEFPYDVHINCAGMTLASVYEYLKSVTREDSTYPMYVATTSPATLVYTEDGEEYQRAQIGYALSKTAPFGTFAGGVFFGARGVWVQNMDSGDSQNYQLTDAGGNTRTPPNFQALTVTAASPGDRISIFRTTGDNFTINKALYTVASGVSGGNSVYVSTPIATDTPTTGFLRIVDVSASNFEWRRGYTSWTGTIFTLGTNLASNLANASDTVYVPYIDVQATQTSVSQTVIYASDRFVMARVRLKGIIPFQTKGTFKSTGYSTAAIRTTDTIVE
ncbi:MAG: hypothetical protein ACW99G_19180 [Candidatus Thorarchaeota archaeon]|jgi:hypothetical protein